MESRGCKAGSGIEGPRHGLAAAQSAANALVSGGGTQDRVLPLVWEVDNRHVAPVVVAVANVTTIVAATQKPVVLLRRRLQRHCLRFVQGLLTPPASSVDR
ncbi:hypothetical protein ZWY2020_011034 [Hordeum vulgare]|nr:hypothetical protein ZWY2020_011034 [Hordeum vulgare]